MERFFIVLRLASGTENEAPSQISLSFMSEEFAFWEKSDSQYSAFFNNKTPAIWFRSVPVHRSCMICAACSLIELPGIQGCDLSMHL